MGTVLVVSVMVMLAPSASFQLLPDAREGGSMVAAVLRAMSSGAVWKAAVSRK